MVNITVDGIPAKAAVPDFAYKISMGFLSDVASDHSRFAAPTVRAWERWIEAGNEQPDYIIFGDVVYYWRTGMWTFYDYAFDGIMSVAENAKIIN